MDFVHRLRKCSFYDLAECPESGTGNQHQQPERLEVILKIIDDELSIDQVDAIRHGVNVGDIVRIHGFIERTMATGDEGRGSILLHARNMIAVLPWKELHPSTPFVPTPTITAITKEATIPVKKQSDDVEAVSENDANSSKSVQQPAVPAKVVHCKFWINSRTCQYGDKCELFHVDGTNLKAERAKWLQERLHLKRVRAKHDADPLDAHGKQGKQQRAQVFVDWLVEKFGTDFLSTGAGVVDVAGGRGNVSFELWNKRKIPCTLIDPRPMKLSKMQFKYMKKLNKEKHEINDELVPQKRDLFNVTTFLENPENEALVKNASILVGMHPDEATDAIIDVAILYDKPFVLVPCCVFGHKFPERVVPGTGNKVVSYEDLVAYLMAKHPDIQQAFLPFDGKNLVLYRQSIAAEAAQAKTTGDETEKGAVVAGILA
uniref:C3H1-type domain-containing protein n=1 Tax=Globisporangium ultimum (strain ATCC 200006 / CBS 805.95 / DAOM BR144) TaxID=431595 RepID=K3WHT4_GLOUD